MIIRIFPITPRRGNKPPAQGNALGNWEGGNRPDRATMNILTPKALPWAMCLQAFQAALRIQADNL